ncbi:NAD(P)-binding protein [Hyaloscypha variabilis]
MATNGNTSTTIPKTMKAWSLEGTNGFDSLTFHGEAPLPEPSDYEVLVKFHAASLNYRDLLIPKGQYPFPCSPHVTPLSDGAGTIVSLGPKVTRFQPGDKVCTLFNQAHLGGPLTPPHLASGLGSAIHGTLRQYGTFNENGLVSMPSNLGFREAASLSCAGVTAWNALYGAGKGLRPGDWVLTIGTGGVSIFAVQFAKAAGAKVISTTSSPAKAELLRKLGADVVLNYKETENWGEEAKKITGGGVDFVVEVGGPSTFAQSLKSVKIGGSITVVGFVGGPVAGAGFLDILGALCTVRSVLVGSRDMFEAMNAAIQGAGIVPHVDERAFGLEEAREAYEYMWSQKHFGKVVVSID